MQYHVTAGGAPPAHQQSQVAIPIAAGLVRYVYVAFALELLLGIAGSFQRGLDLRAALAENVFTLIWVGWILDIAGLPVAGAFLLLLYRVAPRFMQPNKRLAVALSAVVWGLVVLGLQLFAIATNSLTPGQIVTVGSLLSSGLIGALVGAIFGVFEALAMRRRPASPVAA